MKIAIVGAGMAGLTCAERLGASGHDVQLYDKGRGAGGRMASRRMPTDLGETTFDMGAQYMTARDMGFVARVERWRDEGLVAAWPAMGNDAWIGVPVMNAPLKSMAAGQAVVWSTRVEALSRDQDGWSMKAEGARIGPFDAVIVAVPAEQAEPLLRPWTEAMATCAALARSAPCWTLMAVFAERLPLGQTPLRRHGIIDWAARAADKPGRSGAEAWVVHASAEWSTEHLEDDPTTVAAALLSALAHASGQALPAPLEAKAHRWRFARSGAAGQDMLWNGDLRLGVCGDWLLGPRVECAWLSGDRLAAAILQNGQPG